MSQIDRAIAEIEQIGKEYPDGIHACEQLQMAEPGRRPCTCGRCPGPDQLPGQGVLFCPDNP